MRRSRFFAGVAVAAIVAVHATGSAPRAAAQDVDSILEASARAMEHVQSMRFSGTGAMTFGTAEDGFSMTMEISGVYRAPDRMRLSMSIDSDMQDPSMASMPGGVMEMIVVGDDLWARLDSGNWERSSMGSMMGGADMGMISPGMFTPSMFSPGAFSPGMFSSTMGAPPGSDFMSLFPGAALSDGGSVHRITADLDFAGLMGQMAAEKMDSSMTGMDLFGGATSMQLSFDINKATHYVERVEIAMSVPSLMMVNFTGTMTDFNSPTISVEPPL